MGAKPSIVASAWSGPLPPPETLEAFKRVSPDAVEAILSIAKEEQRIRFELTVREQDAARQSIASSHADVRRGQYVAAGLIGFVAALATVCAFFGEWQVGCALAGFGAVGIAYAFIGDRSNKK